MKCLRIMRVRAAMLKNWEIIQMRKIFSDSPLLIMPTGKAAAEDTKGADSKASALRDDVLSRPGRREGRDAQPCRAHGDELDVFRLACPRCVLVGQQSAEAVAVYLPRVHPAPLGAEL